MEDFRVVERAICKYGVSAKVAQGIAVFFDQIANPIGKQRVFFDCVCWSHGAACRNLAAAAAVDLLGARDGFLLLS